MQTLTKNEKLFLTVLASSLALFNFQTENSGLVWNSLYFYKNSLEPLFTPLDLEKLISAGFISNMIGLVQLQFDYAIILRSILVAVIAFIIGRFLHLYFIQSIPRQPSLLLVALIFLTPTHGEIREIITSPDSIRFTGLLFSLFPHPFIMLAGISIMLWHFNGQRIAREISLSRAFFLSLFLYLFHPFLFLIFLICFIIHTRILRLRGLGRISVKRLDILLVIVTSLVLVLTFYQLTYSTNRFSGTLTINSPSEINYFEIVFYLLLPIILLGLALFFINVSVYEIAVRYHPIIALFCIEISLTFCSLITSKNLLFIMDFNGLSQIFHVLYYIPTVFVVTSINRRQRIKWIHFTSYGKGFEEFSSFFITKVSSILVLVILTLTLHNNKDVLLGRFECLSAKRIVKISEALQQRSRLEFFNDLGSGELQDDVFDSADLRNFLKVPDLTGTLDKQEYDYCSVSGVGFLILNGFSFDEAALARSTSMKNSLQEFFND